jgi:pimeloyl-ACP methyl ester carboxylesterase
LGLCALAVTALGCSYGITVRQASGPDLLLAWRASVNESGDLSPRTRQTLHRWDLDAAYQHSPSDALTRLQVLVVQHPQPDLLFALAEVSFLLAKQAEKKHSMQACGYYYLCAGYAYHFLFDEAGQVSNAFDPRFRLACDLYNTSLAKCIRAAQRIGRLDPRQELRLPTPDGRGFTLSVVHHGFPWQPAEFGPLSFSADYEVVGLANNYRGYGLGVALIGNRVSDPQQDLAPGHAFYLRNVSFPVTAFFRFEGTVADLGACRSGRLELYNPLTVHAVDVNGWSIPLETDLTTPLAYFLAHTDLEGIEYTGFLRADQIKSRVGIYMFEPYQPGKIPVLMIHGLLGSPLTWTPMFNDLRADPTLREHFQFWFYLYPTGDPYLATAADLRQAIDRLRAEVDPDHHDPALDHMVLVGHSMGGLIAKLLTVPSSRDFWHLVSAQPPEKLKLSPKDRAELEHIFFFERQPEIERVVFIATPHHGSKLSPSLPAQLVTRFIRAPKDLLHVAGDIAKDNPHAGPGLFTGRIPTSVDLLAPKAPALELLAARPRPAGVHYHSVIGEIYGTGESGTDGVVPYTSSHLDDVDSEVTVPASHLTVHHHPRAVLEVWRVLLEHLRAVKGMQDVPAAPALRPLPEGSTRAGQLPEPRVLAR